MSVIITNKSSTSSNTPPVSVIADTPTSTIPMSSVFYDITGWTVVEDTNSAFNPTTGIFTAPKTALYDISIDLYLSFTAATVNNSILSHILVDTGGGFVTVREGNTRLASGVNAGQVAQASTWRLTMGDKVKFQVASDASSNSFVAGSLPNFFSIFEVQ